MQIDKGFFHMAIECRRQSAAAHGVPLIAHAPGSQAQGVGGRGLFRYRHIAHVHEVGTATGARKNAVCIQALRRLRRSEEHTSELQSLMRISYAVFCLKKKNKTLSLLTNNT